MKVIKTYYKNSNSGDLIFSTEYTETSVTGFPVYWYRNNECIGEDLDIKSQGYVEISEKKFLRQQKFISKGV